MNDIPPAPNPIDVPTSAPVAAVQERVELSLSKVVSPYISPAELVAYREVIGEDGMKRLLEHNLKCLDEFNAQQIKNAEHRRKFEMNGQSAAIEDAKSARRLQWNGQVIAAVLIAVALIVAGYLGANDRTVASGLVGVGGPSIILLAVVLRYFFPAVGAGKANTKKG